MKRSIALLVVLLCALVGVNTASAVTKYWYSSTANGCSGGGGGGLWDRTTANWQATDSGTCPGNTTFANGDDAIFGGAPGSVVIPSVGGNPLLVNRIQVDTGGYKFALSLTSGNFRTDITTGRFTITSGVTTIAQQRTSVWTILNAPNSPHILYIDGAGTLDFADPYTGVYISVLGEYVTGGGTLIIRSGGPEPSGHAADYYKLDNNSTLRFAGFNPSYTASYGGLTIGSVGGNISVDSPYTATFAVAVAGSGILGATGAGTLALTGASSGFIGGLAANAGTLTLGASSAMSSLTSVSVGAGGTLNVSAFGTYTLPSTASFSASGDGIAAATINGGTTVSLGSSPITLAYDGSNPALTVSPGAIQVQGNVWTVNGLALTAGAYNIMQGAATATVSGTHTVYGTAIEGSTGGISGSDVNVVLTVTAAATATTTTVTSSANPSTYGTGPASFIFTATVSPSPAGSGTVLFAIDGVPQLPAAALSGNTATCTVANSFSAGSHTVVAQYSGSGATYGSSVGTLSQIVQPKPLTVTGITASNKPCDGTTTAVLNTSGAALVGVVSGDDVTLQTAGAIGAFADPAVGTNKVVNITDLTITGAAVANYALTQPTTLANITATVLVSAQRLVWDLSKIVVLYSSEVSSPSATLSANYSLNNGAAITSAVFGDTPNKVILSTSNLVAATAYSLTVQNVQGAFGYTIAQPAVVPLGFYPASLALWLKSDTGVVYNGTNGVTSWADQSGNGNNASPPNITNAPLYVANAFGTLPGLRFDGTNQYLFAPSSPSLAISGDLTIYVVATINVPDWASTVNEISFLEKTAGTLGNLPAPYDYYLAHGTGLPRLYRGNGAVAGLANGTTSPSVGSVHAFSVVMSGNNVVHYLDSLANGTGVISTTIADGGTALGIGSRHDLGPKMQGDMAEILMFSSALSDADRQALDDYLTSKFFASPVRLDVSRSGSDIIVSWPVTSLTLNLQATTNLATPAWTPVTEPVVPVGGTNTVTITPAGGAQFYHLSK